MSDPNDLRSVLRDETKIEQDFFDVLGLIRSHANGTNEQGGLGADLSRIQSLIDRLTLAQLLMRRIENAEALMK